jgi:predicted component of type VI protein secretion system
MDGKIILQFRGTGGKNLMTEFRVQGSTGIRLGSDPTCEARFDSDALVSPAHCRLDVEPPAIKLTDLNSRHGTFVNQQRVLGSVVLRRGDILHLGAGGPQVEFDFDGSPIPATPPPTPAKVAKKPRSYRLLAVGALILLIAAAVLALYGTALMGATKAL